MKKQIVPLILLLFICVSVISLAEKNIDLSTYTDEELISLSSQIRQEIVSRKLEQRSNFAAGNYQVGTDIPAGRYFISWEAIVMFQANISIKENNQTIDRVLIYNFDAEADGYCRGKWQVELKAGQTLSCSIPITLQLHTDSDFE